MALGGIRERFTIKVHVRDCWVTFIAKGIVHFAVHRNMSGNLLSYPPLPHPLTVDLVEFALPFFKVVHE